MSSLIARVAARASQAARTGANAGRLAGRQTRGFASEGHGSCHGHGAHDVTYEGLTLHPASKWHTYGGKAFASVMWFWVFYRFYNDFDHFVYGPAAHLEHELHHDAEHAAHH